MVKRSKLLIINMMVSYKIFFAHSTPTVDNWAYIDNVADSWFQAHEVGVEVRPYKL